MVRAKSRPRLRVILSTALALAVAVALPVAAADTTTGETATGARRPFYMPHMSWDEVEDYLEDCDMVIVPVGSMEQHGKHLPLCSDIVQATEICLRIGQKARVLVAPAVLAGVSEHHMAFPGTLSLSPATFEAVLYETTQCLIAHGFRRIIYYSGHGGNYTSVSNVAFQINRDTEALAIDLLHVEFPAPDPKIAALKDDSHAGVEETSMMLLLAPGLVRMDKAENPKLTYPPLARKIREKADGFAKEALLNALLYQPLRSGKLSSTRELSNNGVVTGEDLKLSSEEIGRLAVDYRVDGVVRFIEAWRKVKP
ncbi:MAG: creatininase family protein [Acidobacteria bacterium]|nr:creatininase family protein [Acidobacteriota bacterium]